MNRLFENGSLRKAATELWENGYALIPGYKSVFAQEAQEAYRELIHTGNLERIRLLRFITEYRPDGTPEWDDGFLNWVNDRDNPGKDTKHVFHWRPDTARNIREILFRNKDTRLFQLVDAFLSQCTTVHGYHLRIVLNLLEAFDMLGVVQASFLNEFIGSYFNPGATSRAVTRLLYYPETAQSSKAKRHLDRSFITLYGGDTGGSLYGVFPDGSTEIVSPKEGEILVFWGFKAKIFAREHDMQIEPLAHEARTEGGAERQAVVSFFHINRELWDAPPVPY